MLAVRYWQLTVLCRFEHSASHSATVPTLTSSPEYAFPLHAYPLFKRHGDAVGSAVGCNVEIGRVVEVGRNVELGRMVGEDVDRTVTRTLGHGCIVEVGGKVGCAVGCQVGHAVGIEVGSAVGGTVGGAVGGAVGSAVGEALGNADGLMVGGAVGSSVGCAVG